MNHHQRPEPIFPPLRPMPPGWQAQWDYVTAGNEWLRHKLNRTRRLRDHVAYLREFAPEILAPVAADNPPGVVVDLGPGGGELLELARAAGHEAIGIDAPFGFGGMGDRYLAACELLWRRQELTVYRCGAISFFRSVLKADEFFTTHTASVVGRCVLINSRGSMEQIFAAHLNGAPHHEHHRAADMEWRLGDRVCRSDIRRMFLAVAKLLRPGGAFVIHFNGSRNHHNVENQFDLAALEAGLEKEIFSERKRRYRKTNTELVTGQTENENLVVDQPQTRHPVAGVVSTVDSVLDGENQSAALGAVDDEGADARADDCGREPHGE